MKITRSGNQMIVKDNPGCLWIFGLIAVIIGGIFVFGAVGGYANYQQSSPLLIAIHFLVGAIAAASGIWFIAAAPFTKVVIDRNTETITFTRIGLKGKTEEVYKFNEIKAFCLIEGVDDEGDPVWSLGIEMPDGERIKISTLESTIEEEKRSFVFQTNEFIYRQMPSYRTIHELEDES